MAKVSQKAGRLQEPGCLHGPATVLVGIPPQASDYRHHLKLWVSQKE